MTDGRRISRSGLVRLPQVFTTSQALTIDSPDHCYFDTTSGDLTCTLPAASAAINKELTIKKTVATNFLIFSGTVDGATPTPLRRTGEFLRFRSDGTNWNQVGIFRYASSSLFVQTANVAIANSAAETSLLSTGSGITTLPANFFTVGRNIDWESFGFFSNVAATMQFKIKLGGTTILDSTAVSPGAYTNGTFQLKAKITCVATGASNTLRAQALLITADNTNGGVFSFTNTADLSINTATSLALGQTFQWGTALLADTLTITNNTVSTVN